MQEDLLASLNKAQREAVLCCEGPLLILAGAGSGKTRVLTHKMLYLIKNCGVKPDEILAVTFTNKAANEMKERIRNLLHIPTWNLWISTFHSACVRILRDNAEKLGYTKNFVIYDDRDQRGVIKKFLKELDIDSEQFKPKSVQNAINRAKNNLITCELMQADALSIFDKTVSSIYIKYQEELKENDAMDFGDIILNAVTLLEKHPDVLNEYQKKFRHIMVDEYQDTNLAQYTLLKLLAKAHKNICVVGDDDQSIYKFRGANIKNILDFEKDYKKTTIVKLEQNYRSTKTILKAAYSVISKNKRRKEKKLFTDNPEGEKIKCYNANDEVSEAKFVIKEIKRFVDSSDYTFRDIAIFFRTNAQSRVFEDEFLKQGIPCVVVGGQEFYSRAEIKDMISYLKLAAGSNDIVSVKRIINNPRRGIGKVTFEKVTDMMEKSRIDFFTAIEELNDTKILNAGSKKKLELFRTLIYDLRNAAKTLSVSDLITRIYNQTGYKDMLEKSSAEEDKDRTNNISEFISGASQFEEETKEVDLGTYLDFISLVTDADRLDENKNRISLITLHKAKGLEYPLVFMTGMEEGIFPHANSLHEKEELEEERRLCYVGITRAKERLIMTHASIRRTYNSPSFQRPSRFLTDIPGELLTGTKMGLDSPGESFSFNYTPKNSYHKRQKIQKRDFHEDPHGFSYQQKILDTYFNDEPEESEYVIGRMYIHPIFGKGKLKNVEGAPGAEKLTIYFQNAGTKKILAKYAKLTAV